MTCNGVPTVPPVLEFFNCFLKFMFILKVPLYNIPGCYPEILGKWRFRGTGKNLRGLVFPTQLESMGVLSLLIESRAEALDISDIIRCWRPENIILNCSIPRQYSKISILLFQNEPGEITKWWRVLLILKMDNLTK